MLCAWSNKENFTKLSKCVSYLLLKKNHVNYKFGGIDKFTGK